MAMNRPDSPSIAANHPDPHGLDTLPSELLGVICSDFSLYDVVKFFEVGTWARSRILSSGLRIRKEVEVDAIPRALRASFYPLLTNVKMEGCEYEQYKGLVSIQEMVRYK